MGEGCWVLREGSLEFFSGILDWDTGHDDGRSGVCRMVVTVACLTQFLVAPRELRGKVTVVMLVRVRLREHVYLVVCFSCACV